MKSIDKINEKLKEAETNENIIVDVICNTKTKERIIVVTDYYNNNRMRAVDKYGRTIEVTDEKIINLEKAKNKLYERKLVKAEYEYAEKINKPVELWSNEDLTAFNGQLVVELKNEEELIDFNKWKNEYYEKRIN